MSECSSCRVHLCVSKSSFLFVYIIQSIYQSGYLSGAHSVYYLFACLSVCPSVCLSACLFICLVVLPLAMYVYTSVCHFLFVFYLSGCLSLSATRVCQLFHLSLYGSICTKASMLRQFCDHTGNNILIKTMELIQNGVATHFQATLLFSMRTLFEIFHNSRLSR